MRTFIVIMMSISVGILLALSGRAAPLQVVTLQQPPLEYEEDGVIKGIAVDLVNEVFARMQQPITLNLYPFARALKMVKTGKADAIFAIVKNPEREGFLTYPHEVLIEQDATLFARKDASIPFDGDFRPLSAYTFGILRAATYGPQWEEAVSSGMISQIEETNSYRQNVLKLVNHRVDIIIGPRLSILYAAKELGYQDAMQELAPPIEMVPTYLTFSQTGVAPETIELFSQILKELKDDGTYAKIIRTYIE